MFYGEKRGWSFASGRSAESGDALPGAAPHGLQRVPVSGTRRTSRLLQLSRKRTAGCQRMVDLPAARSFVRRASGASVDGRGFATRTEEVMHFNVVGGSLLALWLRVQRVCRDVGSLCHCPFCGETGRRALTVFPSASGPVTQRGRA